MKTLHVTNRLYPEFNGGTEIHVRELCTQLAKAGEKTVVLIQQVNQNFKTIFWKKTQESGLTIYRLCLPTLDTKIKLLQSMIFKHFRLVKLFLEVLNKEKPAVVHFHHLTDLSPLLPIICWYKKIPQVIDLVDYWFLCPNIYLTCRGSLHRCATDCTWSRPTTIMEALIGRTKKKWLKDAYGYLKVIVHRTLWKGILNYTNSVLVPISERTKEIYTENGIRESKMVIKPCGIIIKKPLPKGRRKFLRVGYLGAVIPVKGVKVLIDAFKKVRGQNFRLDLFGQNGFPENTLFKILKDDRRIVLHPSFDHQDLSTILSSIDVLVVPSVWEETFGIVIQEGLAAHLPVIASQIGGLPERIVDDVNGFLVKPGSVSDLAKKLTDVLRHYEAVRSRLDYHLGQFPLSREVKQVVRIYNGLVKQPYYDLIFVNGIPKEKIH